MKEGRGNGWRNRTSMARTCGYALVGALLATFTVTPVLASYLLPLRIRETETIVVRALRAVYQPVLRWALSRRRIMVLIGIGFLVSTTLLAPRLGGEFLPVLEEGNLWIRVTMPPTISLESGMPVVDRMRQILLSHPEVVTVVSQHGRPDDGSDAAGFYNAEFFAPLKPLDQWTPGLTKDHLIEDVQKEFTDEFLGITFNFSQYIQDNIQEGLSGIKGANSIKIIGRDLTTLEHIATQVLSVMDQVKGVSDLGVFRVLGQPNLNITVDREKAARYGLNVGDVNTVVQGALGGAQATTVLEGERQFGLIVRVAAEYRASLDKVRAIKVGFQTSSGPNAYIPLSELATITLDTGASYIYHERNQRFIPIHFSARGRDLEGTVVDAEEQMRRVEARIKRIFTATELLSATAQAEWYVAAELGATLPNDFSNISGTGGFTGNTLSDLRLTDAFEYGFRLGYFLPSVKWVGFETQVFNTNPRVKDQNIIINGVPAGQAPGSKLIVTAWTFNLVGRVPLGAFEPYNRSRSWHFLCLFDKCVWHSRSGQPGHRAWPEYVRWSPVFVTPSVAMFVEYKHDRARFTFDSFVATDFGVKGTYSASTLSVGVWLDLSGLLHL